MPKSKYETNVQPRLREIEAWCRDGVTERDMAHNLRVSYASFQNYKKSHLDLLGVLTRTRSYVDDVIVTGSLLKRIEGYTEKVTVTKYKWVPLDSGELVKVPAEEVVSEVHYPGDTKAAEWWLAMRQRQKWTAPDESTQVSEEATVIEIPAISELVEPVDTVDTEEVTND